MTNSNSTNDVFERLSTQADEKRKLKGIKLVATQRSDVYNMNPLLLEVEPGFNIRTIRRQEEEDSLYAYIADGGTIPPLVIRTEVIKDVTHYFIVDGHRRHDAVMKAINNGIEVKTVPCMKEAPGYDARRRQAAILRVYNNNASVAPEDKGRFIVKCRGWGWTPEEIEKETGINRGQQERLISLIETHPTLRGFIRNNDASLDFVRKIREDSDSDEEAIKKVEAAIAVRDAEKTEGKVGSKKATAKHLRKAGIEVKDTPTQVVTKLKNMMRSVGAEGKVDHSKKGLHLVAFDDNDWAVFVKTGVIAEIAGEEADKAE